MKKFILIIVLVLSSVPTFAQLKDSVHVKNSIYELMYSETLEEPLWIKYTVQCPNGVASRAGMDFYIDKTIHTSDAKDYAQNVYDKGHMAPAADFNCTKDMLYLTFSYLNCTLQQQSLNRGVWKTLEIQERELAKVNSNVKVYIKIEFDATPKRVLTNAAIPKAFYKEIVINNTTKLCYYFLNVAPQSNDLNTFKCNCR
jgi:endonuclease G